MASEKEVNVYLIEQLRIITQALKVAREENAEKTIAFLENEQAWTERKLYQNPPLER